jgi:DNA-binding MarR family transcriptional regulator
VATTNLNENSNLTEAVMEAADVLLRVAARSVVEVEARVSTPQLRVLVFIARRGAQSAGAIAAELGVHASNATRICDRLTRAGLISRSADPVDRRFIRLELTEDGRNLVSEVLEHRRASVASIVARISPARRAAALEAFRTFAAASDEPGASDGRFVLTLNSPG